MNHKFLRLIICLLITLSSLSAFALTDEEKLKIIEAQLVPLKEDQIFYRYQTKVSGEKFLKEKVWTNSSYKHFMAMPSDPNKLAAGQGLYIAEKPHTSAHFAPKDGTGTLIEVRVAKGTPSLDLTNKKVLRELNRKGVTPYAVYRLNPKAVIKYYGIGRDWWVAKIQDGISFHPFTGENLSSKYIQSHYNRLSSSNAGPKKTYRTTVDPILTERQEAIDAATGRIQIMIDGKDTKSIVNIDNYIQLLTDLKHTYIAPNTYDNFLQKHSQFFIQLNPTPSQQESFLGLFNNPRLKNAASKYVIEGKKSCYWIMTNLFNR